MSCKHVVGYLLALAGILLGNDNVCKADGVIVSGGGYVYETKVNPWFLENTKEVSYCIDLDPATFHLDQQRVEQIVTLVIQNWQNAFRQADENNFERQTLVPFGIVRIATQTFVQEECRSTTMLRLQFGKLYNAQRPYIPDPTQVIAETVRTSYDEVNLRGAGFIYISADSGQLRPASSDIDENRWTFGEGVRLRGVLEHEFGHLFGLQHSGGEWALMGELFPEALSRKSIARKLATQEMLTGQAQFRYGGSYGFQFPYSDVQCLPDKINDLPVIYNVTTDLQKQFFGIPQDWRCQRIDFAKDRLTVYAKRSPDDQWQYMGATDDAQLSFKTYQTLLRIKLPAQQRVFTKLPRRSEQSGYLDGPVAVRRYVIKALYHPVANPAVAAQLKATLFPDQMYELEGVVNGRIEDFMIYVKND